MGKEKKCKVCQQLFVQFRTTQKVCSVSCSIELVKRSNIALERTRKATVRRSDKERLKSRGDWLKEAQAAFNAFIRERDKDLPCISCGTQKSDIQYCAGHYRTRGAAGHLRFSEINVNKQCNRHCNLALSGNIAAYRVGLIVKYGEQAVIDLENNNETYKYTIDEIKAIKTKYKQLIINLRKTDN